MPYIVYRHELSDPVYSHLVGPRTNVGSGGWNDDVRISIAHASVETLHASIEAIEGGYQLTDRSGGKTWVRGRPIREITLVDGMDFQMGEVYATFHEGEVEVAPKTAPGLPDDEGALPEKLWLVVKGLGDGRTLRVPLARGDTLLIGSSEPVDVRLRHPTVSGLHARLTHEGRRLVLRAGGRNGTWVDGVKVETCELELDTAVRIGPCTLYVEPERVPHKGLTEFQGIYTSSDAMRAVFPTITRVAQDPDRVVVVHAETGAGKEAVVRALHALSPRASGPFVALSCADFSEALLEAELFGTKRGAFTGALDHKGVFEQANGGTLFLDEIGELAPGAQSKLLRVLQEKVVRPLGSQKSVRVDVRVIVATHRDLKQEVDAGRFRADLYYRLMVLRIELPPLRDRGDDAVLLFRHFMREAKPHGRVPEPTAACDARLRAHRWPGNVRELKNAAERAALNVPGGTALGPELLDLGEPPAAKEQDGDGLVRARGLPLWSVEKEAIALAMRDHRGNRKSAAEQLGISATTLLKKLRDYGLDDEGKGS